MGGIKGGPSGPLFFYLYMLYTISLLQALDNTIVNYV